MVPSEAPVVSPASLLVHVCAGESDCRGEREVTASDRRKLLGSWGHPSQRDRNWIRPSEIHLQITTGELRVQEEMADLEECLFLQEKGGTKTFLSLDLANKQQVKIGCLKSICTWSCSRYQHTLSTAKLPSNHEDLPRGKTELRSLNRSQVTDAALFPATLPLYFSFPLGLTSGTAPRGLGLS